jgi:hypothetical protein
LTTAAPGAKRPLADLRSSHDATSRRRYGRRNLVYDIAAVDGFIADPSILQMAIVLTALEGMISAMAGAAGCQRTPNDQSKQEECHEKKSLS